MKPLILAFSLLFFLSACKTEKRPDNVVEKQKMIDVMTDMSIASGYISTVMQRDTVKMEAGRLYFAVYQKYGIDSATYVSSLNYYSRRPKEFDDMYYHVSQRLEKRKAALADTVQKK